MQNKRTKTCFIKYSSSLLKSDQLPVINGLGLKDKKIIATNNPDSGYGKAIIENPILP